MSLDLGYQEAHAENDLHGLFYYRFMVSGYSIRYWREGEYCNGVSPGRKISNTYENISY